MDKMFREVVPKKMSDMMDTAPSMSEPIYPCVTLPLDVIPEAEQWVVGDEYVVELSVKMKSLCKSKDCNDVTLEVMGVNPSYEEQND